MGGGLGAGFAAACDEVDEVGGIDDVVVVDVDSCGGAGGGEGLAEVVDEDGEVGDGDGAVGVEVRAAGWGVLALRHVLVLLR